MGLCASKTSTNTVTLYSVEDGHLHRTTIGFPTAEQRTLARQQKADFKEMLSKRNSVVVYGIENERWSRTQIVNPTPEQKAFAKQQKPVMEDFLSKTKSSFKEFDEDYLFASDTVVVNER